MYKHIIIFVLNLTGYGLIFWQNWVIATGIFLIHWMINYQKVVNEEESRNNIDDILNNLVNPKNSTKNN